MLLQLTPTRGFILPSCSSFSFSPRYLLTNFSLFHFSSIRISPSFWQVFSVIFPTVRPTFPPGCNLVGFGVVLSWWI